MSQVFDEEGIVHPVTVISAGPVTVTDIKSKDGKDGYDAVQVGYGKNDLNRLNKAEKGHLTKKLADKANGFKYLKEFRSRLPGQVGDLKIGDSVDLGIFSEGEKVTVSAITKGKGFQGVVKRHGFKGGPRSHGQRHNERAPGSIGGGGRDGGRVAKGMRMAGRMGGDRVTVKNLKLIRIDKDSNLVLVGGAVPGRRGTLVEIYN